MSHKKRSGHIRRFASGGQTLVSRPIIIIFCLLSFMFLFTPATPSLAAPSGWAATYRGGGYDVAHYVQQTTDGGYIVAGRTDSFGAGEEDIWVLKLRPDGTVEWQKTYGGVGWDVGGSIRQTSDGGYVVTGETDSFGAGSRDFWILKLRPDGTVEWQKTYGGVMQDDAESIRQTRDGGYIVVGMTDSFGAGRVDIWVLKLRPDGSVEWQKCYGGRDWDWPNSIEQTSDGGYIVAGSTHSFDFGKGDFMVLKLGPDGSVEWQKTYGRGNYDRANSIRQTRDGGYIVAGLTESFTARVEEIPDVWALKLRPDGTVEWQKTYGGIDFDEPHSIRQTRDGGYIMAGDTGYVMNVVEGTISTSGGHAWILKLRPDGTIDWQRAYENGNIEGANSIQQTTDGGFIVAGETFSLSAGHTDFLVLKLTQDGSIDPSCDFLGDTGFQGTDSNAAVLDSDVIVNVSNVKPRRSSATVQDTDVSANFLCASTGG